MPFLNSTTIGHNLAGQQQRHGYRSSSWFLSLFIFPFFFFAWLRKIVRQFSLSCVQMAKWHGLLDVRPCMPLSRPLLLLLCFFLCFFHRLSVVCCPSLSYIPFHTHTHNAYT